MASADVDTVDRDPSGEDDEIRTWANERLAEAMQHARNHETEAALTTIDVILRRCPDHLVAVLLGIDLARQHDETRRLQFYRAILLALQPKNWSNRIELAQAMTNGPALRAAHDLLERLPPNTAGTLEIAVLKLQVAGRSGDGAELAQALDRLAVEDTSNAAVQHVDKIAAALVAGGDAGIALHWLDRHLPLFESHPAFLLRRAQVLYGLQRWDEAHAAFTRLQVEHPNPDRRRAAGIFRARVSRNAGEVNRALEEFGTIFAAEPDNIEACDFLVRQHWREGRVEAAAQVIDRFSEAAPDAPAATWLKAESLKRQGLQQQAVDVYRAGMARYASDIVYCSRYADLLMDMGKLDEARKVLDDVAALEPSSALIFNRRIALARRLDVPHDELIALSEAFLVHDARHPEALQQRANSLLRLGRRVEAYQRFAEGARLNPTIFGFWRSAAALAVSLNRRSEAAALAAEARSNFDHERLSDLCALAAIHEAADDMQAALDFAAAAVEIDPSSAEAHAMTGRLLVASGRYSEAWPHLRLAGEEATRSPDLTGLLAQVAAGFRFLRPSQADLVNIEPVEGAFPEVLLEKVAEQGSRLAPEACENLVLHVTSSLAAGGAERQVATTVVAMAHGQTEYRVELVADDVDPATHRDVFLPTVEAAGVPVHVLRRMREAGDWRELLLEYPECAEPVRLIGALPPDMRRVALPLFTLLVRRRPRVVHLWQDMIAVTGCLAAVLAGVPHIVLATRSTRPIEQQRFRRYFESAYAAFLQRPDVVMIGNSRNGARDYEAWLRLPENSVKVVYNGYDFAQMRARTNTRARTAVRKRLGIPDDALVIGGVMRLSFEKRPELWTRVAMELATRDPRVHGVLVGQGPMHAELEAEIAAAGLSERIHLAGQQSPVEPWMSAMDMLFLSSLTEGLPNVLIEAQSLGVPVATMRIGGAPETVIEGETAVIADEGDVAAIADKLAALLFDEGARAAFGKAGRKWTQATFSTEAMLASLAEVYRGAPMRQGAPARHRGMPRSIARPARGPA